MKGRATARNLGVYHASGEIVAFVDSSMILYETCLAEQMLRHQRAPNIALLGFKENISFQRLDFKRNRADEEAADTKALELLRTSPYKDMLGNAGLFLRALQERATKLPNLISPHLGNGLLSGTTLRMSALLAAAPALDDGGLDQIAALPLGGRIKVDPWSDQVEMAKAKPVALASEREKMPFEITPFFPYLARISSQNRPETASETHPQ